MAVQQMRSGGGVRTWGHGASQRRSRAPIPRQISVPLTRLPETPKCRAVQAKPGLAGALSAHAQPLWVDFLTLMTDVPG